MNRSTGRLGEWIGAAVIAGLACALPASAGGSPIDAALPTLGVLLVVLAWLVRETPGSSVLLVLVTVLVVISIGVADEHTRLLLYGIAVAGGIAIAVLTMSRDGEIPALAGGVVVFGALVLMKAIPLALPGRTAILLFGAVALVLVSAREGRVPLTAVALSVALVTVLPLSSIRLALIPLLVASLAWFLREPSFLRGVAALLLAGLAGRWTLPLAVVPLALSAILGTTGRAPRIARPAVVPPMFAGASTLLRVFAFHPGILRDAAAAQNVRVAAAIVLAAGSMFLRPVQALVYLLAGAVLVTWDPDVRGSARAAAPALMIAAAMLVLFSWSGMIVAGFPLPVPFLAVAVVAAILLLGSWAGPKAWVGLFLLALVGGSLPLVTSPTVAGTEIPVQRALGRGEGTTLDLDGAPPTVRLLVSGANVSGLEPGTIIGRIELIDMDGRAWRRTLTIGEVGDWGAGREDQVFGSRLTAPAVPGGAVFGYGHEAFRKGSGVIELQVKRGISAIRITADEDLGPGMRLQVDAMEIPR